MATNPNIAFTYQIEIGDKLLIRPDYTTEVEVVEITTYTWLVKLRCRVNSSLNKNLVQGQVIDMYFHEDEAVGYYSIRKEIRVP